MGIVAGVSLPVSLPSTNTFAPGGLLLITSSFAFPVWACAHCRHALACAALVSPSRLERSGSMILGTFMLPVLTVRCGEYSISSPPFTRKLAVAGIKPPICTVTVCFPFGNCRSAGVCFPVDLPSSRTSAAGGSLAIFNKACALSLVAPSRLVTTAGGAFGMDAGCGAGAGAAGSSSLWVSLLLVGFLLEEDG